MPDSTATREDHNGQSAATAFEAFCEAGMWPGLSRTLRTALPEAGITGPDDVTVSALGKLPRVGPKRAERLFSAWAGAAPAYDVVVLLQGTGLPVRLGTSAVDAMGDDAAGQLRKDPWRLLALPAVRVGEADRFARAVEPDVRREDPRRGRALVGYALVRAAREGHTLVAADAVVDLLRADGVPDPAAAIEAAIDSGAVLDCPPVGAEADEDGPEETDGGDPVADAAPSRLALDRYGMAEQSVAEQIARLTATAEPFPEPDEPVAELALLDAEQRGAVEHVATHGVSLLAGGPGTGKSRTVAAVVALAVAVGQRVALSAPTGRAAKRLAELAGQDASTVHRMLGAQGRDGGFARGEDWPLDADLVVVDETSMLDVELAAALLEACADGTHLLLVGDPAQLPSIGPGRVLGDLLDCGRIPVTELRTLYRQAEGGAIARLATAVRGGELAAVDSPDREVVVVPATGSAQAAHRVVQLVTDSIPRALGIPAADVQVVTPVHRGPAGTIELNRALKAQLNPGKGTVSGFDPGDRVVATANHLDLSPVGFANGEVGVVTAAGDGEVTVDFTAGPVRVSGKALADLRHGWAITVHRAQGSEWPAVVVILPPEASGMLTRPLVYTAMTRAQRHLSVVHSVGPLLARVVRDVGGKPRLTRLAEALVAELDGL